MFVFSCFDFTKLKSVWKIWSLWIFSCRNVKWLWTFFVGQQSEDQVREAIKREIEKEQIRQEIIIAEAARKRELIAEVLQEMAIEREMAIRRVSDTEMSLEEKLTMWINQRKLPNQNQNQFNNFFRQKYSYIDSLINTGSYNSLLTSPIQSNSLY